MANKKSAALAILVCGASLFFLVWKVSWLQAHTLRGNDSGLELIIYLHLFSFLLFFCLVPNIKTIEKSLVYCIAIPFSCCAMLSMGYTIAPFFVDIYTNAGDVFYVLVTISGIPLYFFIGWPASISLMCFCGICLCLQKYSERFLWETPSLYIVFFHRNLVKFKSFECNRFVVIIWIVWVVFMITYYSVFKEYWGNGKRRIFTNAVPICLLSSFLILYLLPLLFDKAKKLINWFVLFFCCAMFPLFWSVLARAIYAVFIYMVIQITQKQVFPRWGIGINNFYLHNYIETNAWFISFFLMLICVIYYFLCVVPAKRPITESKLP